ncbi:hypothetical protein P170DRAFT_422498 [Aspergillus steynii IBT 23096]|uniref:Serine hydrolase domain-containing protein n=1 Tax=Aspergillus steynii IBT 23096 TaxID=1392250 RepID=A0A2I2GF26_9EURO|nr:uncharacterized protein P170DRAFT_422498 [Aspergillus steynii IBT 23096]PLB51488.1 hypothetical protein P170DRAFT_422498 [Aspergillus steynii IBT 23096]
MRFFCLHGTGSNSRLLQQQIAAVRYELGGRHTYDFVEGCFPCEAHPALKGSLSADEQAFSYSEPSDAASWRHAVEGLDDYVANEGPFDGVIGFSAGASLAILWLLWRQQQQDVPVKMGVFFSNAIGPDQLKSLGLGETAELQLSAEDLKIPTAHIWGSCDDCEGRANAECGLGICNPDRRSMYVHGKGHEIPTSADDTIGMVKAIDRAILRAGVV